MNRYYFTALCLLGINVTASQPWQSRYEYQNKPGQPLLVLAPNQFQPIGSPKNPQYVQPQIIVDMPQQAVLQSPSSTTSTHNNVTSLQETYNYQPGGVINYYGQSLIDEGSFEHWVITVREEDLLAAFSALYIRPDLAPEKLNMAKLFAGRLLQVHRCSSASTSVQDRNRKLQQYYSDQAKELILQIPEDGGRRTRVAQHINEYWQDRLQGKTERKESIKTSLHKKNSFWYRNHDGHPRRSFYDQSIYHSPAVGIKLSCCQRQQAGTENQTLRTHRTAE